MNLEFWDFEEWANRANNFPVFLDWSKGCQTMFVLGTTWSQCRVRTGFEVAGDFGPVFVEGKAEYFE